MGVITKFHGNTQKSVTRVSSEAASRFLRHSEKMKLLTWQISGSIISTREFGVLVQLSYHSISECWIQHILECINIDVINISYSLTEKE